ncbi:hypothetical protein B7H27_10405 [Stenotrophomonas maltophilia]|nr:hypothetical protein B7H27_10405 [Stenotrophomonas maltophilia]
MAIKAIVTGTYGEILVCSFHQPAMDRQMLTMTVIATAAISHVKSTMPRRSNIEKWLPRALTAIETGAAMIAHHMNFDAIGRKFSRTYRPTVMGGGRALRA